MLIYGKKPFVFQGLAVCLAMAFTVGLAACGMPEKPEGVDVQGLTHLADQLRARGDDVGAADFYQRALQRKPEDTRARIALAEILEAHGDNLNAAGQYSEALRIDPDDGNLHRDLGRIFIKLGRAEDAKREYEHALKIDSSDVKALNGLGIALDYLGNHGAAQKAYKEALDDDGNDLTTINNLGHSYVLTGAYTDAIKLLEPHLKDKGATPAMRQNLAEAYGMEGMYADAERVGRIDLTPEQVKHNLDYYHARRDQLAVAPKLYADLGSFPTEVVAEAHVEHIKATFGKHLAGLTFTTTPEVKTIGGTPIFVVRMAGFTEAKKLRDMCDKFKKEKYTCVVHDK